MNENLKTFATQADYDAYIAGNYDKPNVSYIEATDEVKFTDYELAVSHEDDGMVAKFIPARDFTGTTFNNVKSYITSITVPSGVTVVKHEALAYCDNVTEIHVSEGVTELKGSAVSDNPRLTLLDLPSTLTTLGNTVWPRTPLESGTATLILRPTTPPTLGINGISHDVAIKVPAESVNAYKAATGWSSYASQITAIDE